MRKLTAYEDINMNGGSHCTNYNVAKKAIDKGVGLVVHRSVYDGQRYRYSKYNVDNLQLDNNGEIVGTRTDGYKWTATKSLCDYAMTGRIN